MADDCLFKSHEVLYLESWKKETLMRSYEDFNMQSELHSSRPTAGPLSIPRPTVYPTLKLLCTTQYSVCVCRSIIAFATCVCRVLHVAVHHGHAVKRLWGLAPVLLSWRSCSCYAVEDYRPRGAFTHTGESKRNEGKLLFQWSHTRVSTTDLKVRTTLYSLLNSTTWKYCSIALIWMVTH